MTKFYLFRHGETFATKENKDYFLKIFSAPILEEGKPAIRKLATYLKDKPSDANYSSPLKRCKQTVEIVNRITGKDFIFDKRLREFFMETHWGLEKRVKSLLNEIEVHRYQSITICTHGAVLMMLKKLLIKRSKQKISFNDYPKPGVLWIIEDNKLEELNFN